MLNNDNIKTLEKLGVPVPIRLHVICHPDYVPTEREMEGYSYLFNTPNTETPPPERYEITGDVFESDPALDTNKKKKENDEDKETSETEPTKH